jgi:hypothetical protein
MRAAQVRRTGPDEIVAQVHAEVPGLGEAWIQTPTLYFAHAIAALMSQGLDTDVEVFLGTTCTHHYFDGVCTSSVSLN